MVRGIDTVCPRCLGAFAKSVNGLECSSCNSVFQVADGIPVLRQDPGTYYGEFPQDEMHSLLAAAREDLETAVRSYLRFKDAPVRLGEYIMGRGRAGWQFLLPVNRRSVVLDLGCGWGTLAWSLAQFCGHVVACDSTLERMQLLGVRKKQDRLRNLQLVCAGDCQFLPFPEDSFNLVVVNGVLEWVPSGLPGNPRTVQKAFLKEIRRVLKPEGCLFLGIENRYAWKTWAMNPDGHTGLRFVPWLPRSFADLYSRVRGKGSYRNYLYGPNQYRMLLAESGFQNIQFQVPCPGYHHPVQMIPFEDKAQLKEAFVRRERTAFRRFRQTVKGTLSAYFPDAFAMIASDQARTAFLDRLLVYIRKELWEDGLSNSPRVSYRVNGEMGIVTVIDSHGPQPFVLKLPLHQRGKKELFTESQIIAKVWKENHPLVGKKHLFAQLLMGGQFEEQDFFVYSRLPGVSGDRLNQKGHSLERAVREAAIFLATLHQDSEPLPHSLLELVEPVREAVSSLASDGSERDGVNRIADGVLEQFSPGFPGAIWSHGDAKPANFMFAPDSGELTGVIDWGTGFFPEVPGYDLSFLFVSSEAMVTRTPLMHQLKQQFFGGLPEHLKGVWQSYLNQTGLAWTAKHYRSLVGYQWMKRLAPLADEYETMRFNHRYLEQMFTLLNGG